MNYDRVGALAVGDVVEVWYRTGDGEWFEVKLESGDFAWVAAAYVTTDFDVVAVPTVSVIPATPTPLPATSTPVPVAPTDTPRPTATAVVIPPTSTAAPVVCDCSGDLYNCADFGTHARAQACYEYCLSLGRGDIHGLDRDKDGIACE